MQATAVPTALVPRVARLETHNGLESAPLRILVRLMQRHSRLAALRLYTVCNTTLVLSLGSFKECVLDSHRASACQQKLFLGRDPVNTMLLTSGCALPCAPGQTWALREWLRNRETVNQNTTTNATHAPHQYCQTGHDAASLGTSALA